MRALTQATIVILAAFAVSAFSCGSNRGIQATIPPAQDLTVRPEPALPQAALESDAAGNPTDAALNAEDTWHDAVLLWGREGWAQIGRVCRWAEEVTGHKIAGVDCPPPPPH